MLSKNFFFLHSLSPFTHSLVLACLLDFEIGKHKMRERDRETDRKQEMERKGHRRRKDESQVA